MKVFARLVNALDSTNKTNLKQEAIARFLEEAHDNDKLWLLALFTGKRPKRPVNTALLKQWAMEAAQIPEWLFLESYASVGDLAETIALILPEPTSFTEHDLSEWMERIQQLKDALEEEKKKFVLGAWKSLNSTERFIFNKLLGGSFRLGLSAQTLINALAKHYNLDANAVAHSIMGNWKMKEVSFENLIKGHYTNTQLSKPYPFCLAYALDKEPEELGDIGSWQVEYKWDGIRGQFIKREGELFIWSRGEELVTAQFPEITETLGQWEGNFVLDGELLVYKNGQVQNFSALQKRLNRKNLSKKLLDEAPVVVFAYDLLEWEGEDWRGRSLKERRTKLEGLYAENGSTGSPKLDPHRALQEGPPAGNPDSQLFISPVLTVGSWAALPAIREAAREINSEGLMLKHLFSPYHTGRKKGDWWKWKIDPLSIDAVLIYAQKGSGRRSAYYTDYTFAVRQGDQLVTIAKAYSGLTDKEIGEVSRFVNKNALEKFGPVRTVRPELVFEIAFEGIAFSSRHKSGVALRFPRIARWRKDKTIKDIDDIEEIKKLIR